MSNQKDIFKEAEDAGIVAENFKNTHNIIYTNKNGKQSLEIRPRDKQAEQRLKHQNVVFWVGIGLLLGSAVVLLVPHVNPAGYSWASHIFAAISGIIVGSFAKINEVNAPKDDR